MKFSIWIRTVFSAYIRKPWDWVANVVVSLGYLKKRKQAKREIEEARRTINTYPDLTAWYRAEKFVYRSESVDVTYRPWITVARRHGDCEDYAELAAEILDGKYKGMLRGACEAKGGICHAFLVIPIENKKWVAMSNTISTGPFDTKEEAAQYFYHKNTTHIWFW